MTSPLPSPPPIRWPAEAIWEAVAPDLPGFTVEVLPGIDSTNSELMRRFKGGPGMPPQLEPVLLVAEQQSAGRGRLGRSWQSRRGDSLTFSLGLPLAPADWSGLSLAVGISVAESLDPPEAGQARHAARPRIGLKWPNDLWLSTPEGERKLGGILVETASWDGLRCLVIGVGINIRAVPLADSAPVGAAVVAPGGLQELDSGLDAPEALLRIVPALVQAVQGFAQFGFEPFQERFAARDVLAGRIVKLSDGTQGTAHGVADNGALRVHTAGGMVEVTSAEVSVRPVACGKPSC
ncbi:biotin--[acetyl-CoA-carboxylase] ligase [Polaromonas glacialis]|uniref:biotin--[acetyl-CoA-carboxylase] ligase n=1 Tax=Polaromonas glacialis TaxID=866564 RepID=UPI00049644A5|nr:biotin--[acetyl-CoA-carboxylase] ligase [Polaromonas glacialis]